MYSNVKAGYIVKIFDRFYKVKTCEPFQYETGREQSAFFSSIAAGATSGFKNITELEPDDKPVPHLFYVTMGVKDGMEYKVKIPTGSSRFGSDVSKDIGFLNNTISPHHAHNEMFGFYLIKNYYPSIEASNVTSVAFTPQLFFRGFKYALELLQGPPMGNVPVKEITIDGVNE